MKGGGKSETDKRSRLIAHKRVRMGVWAHVDLEESGGE